MELGDPWILLLQGSSAGWLASDMVALRSARDESRRRRIAVYVLLVCLAIGVGLWLLPIFRLLVTGAQAVREEKIHLLYYTNLRVAETEMTRFARMARWNQKVRLVGATIIKGDSEEVPASLRILSPREIFIYDDRIELDFGPSFAPFRLVVFDKARDGHGTKKLGDRIWFYSEDGKVPNR
jgi:hypothetical protein